MKAIIALSLMAACLSAYYLFEQESSVSVETDPIEGMFLKWSQEHQKSYENRMEYKFRLSVFKDSVAKINKIGSTNTRYSLALNHLADQTAEEIEAMMGYIKAPLLKAPTILNKGKQGAKEVDWFAEGCVEHVKNQGSCGSCFSFSATGAIESAHCAKTGELIDLADKDCLDCSFRFGNKGCNGGHMTSCFAYFEQSHKICHEHDYPYNGKYGVCHEKNCAEEFTFSEPVISHHTVVANNIDEFMAALDINPLAIAIQANAPIFQHYKEGILHDDESLEDDEGICGTSLNHGVLAVGYKFNGDYESEENFVLVKNSWGDKWGAKGYIKLGFGDILKGGTCGFLLDASYPTTN
jgi:C1A family cysteine protease